MGVTLYTSRIVLRALGEDDFGLYNVVGGIVAMFTFLNGALAGATSRFITYEIGRKDDVQLHKIFNVSLLTHIFIALVIVVLAETIGLWFLYNKMIIPPERFNAAFWVYQISIVSCVFSITQVPYSATIIAHERMKIYAYIGIVEVLLKLLIAYLIAKSKFDKLIFYAALLFGVQVIIMFYYRIYCRRQFAECRTKFVREKLLYKQMFVYAGSDMIGNLAGLAQGQGLNILLNIFFGPAVNAARGIAYQVQGAVTQFSGNFMTAVKPQIIKHYAKGEIKEMFELVYVSSQFSYYLMWLIILPLCLEADYVLTLWLGKYPDYTSSFLIFILILCLIQTLKTPRTIVLHATGKLLLANIVVGILLCSALPLGYLFLKLGGNPECVFWAANITMLLSEFISVFILRQYVEYNIVDYLLKVHLRCLIVTAVSLIGPYLLYDTFIEPSFIRLILTILISAISILITVWVIGVDKQMRTRIKLFLKEKFRR